ncbi:MAG: BTAD domain-containing putative transcriptional regulator [Vulcanimicrobiota bacterium]
MSLEDNPTLKVPDRDSGTEAIRSTLEIHVREPEGPTRVIPLSRPVIEFEVCGRGSLRISCQRGEVFFRNLKAEEPCYLEGSLAESGRLEVGAYVEVAGSRVLLWDSEKATAYLKGYSSPFAGEIWPLCKGENTIGRIGRRQNSIHLDHPAISREHARIVGGPEGYVLTAESTTNAVYVGGDCVSPAQSIQLAHGDLLELGDLHFRFYDPGSSTSQPTHSGFLTIRSLGGFQVAVQDREISDKDWKTQLVKWLLAHLAYEWGRPLAVERILDELWPESPLEKSRNNLNYTLSILRQTLRGLLPAEFARHDVILRSSSSLQLDLSLLREHDYVSLRRHLEQAAKSKGEDGARREHYLSQALQAYRGVFLADCYLDWVQPVRMALEVDVLNAARELTELLLLRQSWKELVSVANKAISIDPLCQWACLALMQSLRETGRSSEALRVFEKFRLALNRELGVTPDVELMLEHQKVLNTI